MLMCSRLAIWRVPLPSPSNSKTCRSRSVRVDVILIRLAGQEFSDAAQTYLVPDLNIGEAADFNRGAAASVHGDVANVIEKPAAMAKAWHGPRESGSAWAHARNSAWPATATAFGNCC